MHISPLDDDYEITSIILEPSLWKMSYGQGCLVEEFKVDKTCSYLGVIYQKELCGMFQVRNYSPIMVDAHIFLMPSYQRKDLAVKAVNACKEYLHDHTNTYKVFTTVPYECEHVHRLLAKTDFEVSGNLTKSVIWNGKLQDQILYSLQVRV